ncbi:MAG TPA: hypothetical protein VGS10_16090 [Terracidiphilus sp.]|nr:hypothetical protein [Terracidiphilus sp.]
MSHPKNRFLFWSPRILTILFALFLSFFALDVFHEAHGFWSTALALVIHLVPTASILLILAAAWRREWMGTVLFAVLAVLYARQALPMHPSWAVAISGPLVAIAALFFADWLAERPPHPAH